MSEKKILTDSILSDCTLCPRECHADRIRGRGYCGVSGKKVYIARAALHFWEEPCISGKNGSGTVFFSGCNLRCIYCQNREISSKCVGREVSEEELSEIFLDLQDQKAHNINLVTPTHYTYQIRNALILSKKRGLKIPVVYNCSGYEKPETLKMVEGLVDIYLTDFKYADHDLSKDLSSCPDYYDKAYEALSEMVRQQPECVFDEEGMMKKGVIIRHLLLPGHVKQAEKILEVLYETYREQVYFSLMNQYTPLWNFQKFPYLNRKVTKREYERLIDFALNIGIEQAFIQEGDTAKESFIPSFETEI